MKNCDFVLVGKQKKELKDHIQKKLNKFQNKYFYGKEFQVIKSLKNRFEIIINKKKYSFSTILIGRVQIKNLLMAIMAAMKSKISLEKIIKIVPKIKSVNGRLEKLL